MSNEIYKSLLSAADCSYQCGVGIPAGYVIDTDFNGEGVLIDPDTGFRVVVLRNDEAGERIIAFAGTQDAQDVYADLKLGWDQWAKQENKSAILDYLTFLDGIKQEVQVYFTGHSLGGALAQYAAYEYAKQARAIDVNAVLPLDISLTTFNAFGGVAAIKQYAGGYDASNILGIKASHFYVDGDFISQLGGEHVGGNTFVIKNYASSLPYDPFVAHSLDTMRLIIDVDDFDAAVSEVPEYLHIPTLQQFAQGLGDLWNDVETGDIEAGIRLATAIVGTVAIIADAPPFLNAKLLEEFDLFANALIGKFAKSESDPWTSQGLLDTF